MTYEDNLEISFSSLISYSSFREPPKTMTVRASGTELGFYHTDFLHHFLALPAESIDSVIIFSEHKSRHAYAF